MSYKVLSIELRRILKARGVTYKDLAPVLGITESGVKKLLTGNDISLSKLEKILKFADIDLHDLLSLTKNHQPGATRLSKQQEEALLGDLRLFNLVVHLAMFENDLEVIKKLNPKLSKNKLQQMLARLSELDLIILQDGKVLRSLSSVDMSSKMNEFFMDSLKKSIQAKLKTESSLFDCIFYVELTKKSTLEFKIAMQKLVDEFIVRSERERRIHSRKELSFYGAQICAVPTSVNSIFPLT